MNPYYNYQVSSPHLFRSGPTRASYLQQQHQPPQQPLPQLNPAPNTNPLYSTVSRRPLDYAPSAPNPSPNSYPPKYSTYTNPYYNNITPSSDHYHSLPYYNSSPYPNTSPGPRTTLNANPVSYQSQGALPNTPPYQSLNSYPVQAFPGTLPQAFPASYGLTTWPGRHPIHSISDKGLEAILIAILILTALDLILVRPHKILQRGN